MRTLIYARYSTDLQNSRSIEGQLADCRARAEREGWTILGEYCDAAISGGKGIDAAARPGLAAMLERVQSGGIDQVLTDTTSRIARNERDGLDIRDILRFAACRLFTLADGVVEGLTASIKAAVDAQQRRDIAHNINFFMNVPVTPEGGLTFEDGLSAPGKYVELKAHMDVIVLISNCPQLNNPCNAYNPTPAEVLVWD